MSIFEGHRKRMREQFLINGLDGLSERRVLELLLFYARPRSDVNPLAHDLIQEFGSLAGVFEATPDQLMAVPGVGEHTAVLIKLLPALLIKYRNSRRQLGTVISTTGDIKELFAPHFYATRNEMVYLACLDAKYKVLGVRKLGEGVANAAEITARKVAETALALNCTIVILAHNHTSGIATPSSEDIATTHYLYELLSKLGVELCDHVVIVDDDMVSMRDSGVFSRYGER